MSGFMTTAHVCSVALTIRAANAIHAAAVPNTRRAKANVSHSVAAAKQTLSARPVWTIRGSVSSPGTSRSTIRIRLKTR